MAGRAIWPVDLFFACRNRLGGWWLRVSSLLTGIFWGTPTAWVAQVIAPCGLQLGQIGPSQPDRAPGHKAV